MQRMKTVEFGKTLGGKWAMIDVPSGGPLVPGSFGRVPSSLGNPYGGSGVGRSGVSRMVPSGSPGGLARVPNTGVRTPPSNMNTDWAAAMSRAALAALQQMLKEFGTTAMDDVGSSPLEQYDEWVKGPAITAPAGFTKVGECVDSGCGAGLNPLTYKPITTAQSNATCTTWTCFSSSATPRNSFAEAYANISPPSLPGGVCWYHSTRTGTTGSAKIVWKADVGAVVPNYPPFNNSHPTTWRRVLPLESAMVGFRTAPMVSVRSRSRARLDEDGRYIAKPSVRPSTDITFGAKGPPRIRVGEHANRPDGAKKRRGLPVGMLAALKAMHGLSEFADAGEALYDALPAIARCAGHRGIVHDWLCVLSHWDAYLDPATFQRAVTNLLVNHVTDEVIGRLMGSNWRSGVRSFSDQYGTAASIGGGYGAPSMELGSGGLWSVRMTPM